MVGKWIVNVDKKSYQKGDIISNRYFQDFSSDTDPWHRDIRDINLIPARPENTIWFCLNIHICLYIYIYFLYIYIYIHIWGIRLSNRYWDGSSYCRAHCWQNPRVNGSQMITDWLLLFVNGGFLKWGGTPKWWFILEHLEHFINIDDFGVPHFWKPPNQMNGCPFLFGVDMICNLDIESQWRMVNRTRGK